jgi:hypothetical protein
MRAIIAALALAAAPAYAEQEAAAWSFSATGYWNAPKGGDGFASGIVLADHGSLHLEARANYEAIHAQSVYAGWAFEWGDEVKFKVTPIAGGVTGSARGPVFGFEASVAAGRFDYYVEAEHVRDREAGHYNYAWTEVGFRPLEWLRVGVVGQHTRVYGTDRERQYGGLAQATWGKATVSTYWFNPGSSDQVAIVSLGFAF